jgi:hypothetical protein
LGAWTIINEVIRSRLSDSVFLSCRADDANAFAHWLHHDFTDVLPSNAVFCDEHTLKTGKDVDQRIISAIYKCSVLIVIVGDNWYSTLKSRCELGERDWVQDEIEQASDRSKQIQVVLVDDANFPRPPGLARKRSKMPCLEDNPTGSEHRILRKTKHH